MEGATLIQIVEGLVSYPREYGTHFASLLRPGTHWQADWQHGLLEVEMSEETTSQHTTIRKATIRWTGRDLDGELDCVTHASLVHVTRQTGIARRRRLIGHPEWRYHGQIPLQGSRWIDHPLACLEGYWGPATEVPEYYAVESYDSTTPCNLEHIPPEVRYLELSVERVTGTAPGIVCLVWWCYEVRAEEAQITDWFPSLRQYRRDHRNRYRHPDGSWQDTPPDGLLPHLWVHDWGDLLYLPQAEQVVGEEDLLLPSLLTNTSYSWRRQRQYYLGIRLPPAKKPECTAQS